MEMEVEALMQQNVPYKFHISWCIIIVDKHVKVRRLRCKSL